MDPAMVRCQLHTPYHTIPFLLGTGGYQEGWLTSLQRNNLSIFCQGESQPSKLLLRQGNVNQQVADVCTSREVRVAHIPHKALSIKVNTETNTLDEYPLTGPGRSDAHENGIPYPYEILSTFLSSHNLNPTWHNPWSPPGIIALVN